MKKSKDSGNMSISIFLSILCFGVISGSEVNYGDKYLFLKNTDSVFGEEDLRLVVLTWPENAEHREIEDCETFTDRELVGEVLRTSENPQIFRTTEEEMENLLKDCSEISRRRRKRDSVDPEEIFGLGRRSMRNRRSNPVPKEERNPRSQFDDGPPNRFLTTEAEVQDAEAVSTEAPGGGDPWPVIWPGTKWCGAGDIAKGYDDLGFHADTDKCCRAHDLCDDLLISGETRNNLTNTSPFTKLSCKCDLDFYHCLDHVDSVTSNSIGNLYFNVLKRQCYDADYPDSKKCKKYITFLKLRCKEYEKDTTAPKVYQWKKAKFYKKIPFPGPLTFTLPF